MAGLIPSQVAWSVPFENEPDRSNGMVEENAQEAIEGARPDVFLNGALILEQINKLNFAGSVSVSIEGTALDRQVKITMNPGGAVWTLVGPLTVNPGETKVFDTQPLSTLLSAKYITTCYNTSVSKVKTLEFIVVNLVSDLKDTVTNKIGSNLAFDLNSVINGANMEVRIVNNDSVPFNIKAARLLMEV